MARPSALSSEPSPGRRLRSRVMDWESTDSTKCTVCLELLLEPVTLPCGHCFCLSCTIKWRDLGTLCCPLCRRRYGAWLRRVERRGQLVDVARAEIVKRAIARQEPDLSQPPRPTLSTPGEIRSEYQAELLKLQKEREVLEKAKETEKLILELQEKERQADEIRLQELKKDQEYAKKIAQTVNSPLKIVSTPNGNHKQDLKKNGCIKHTINKYFEKINKPIDAANVQTSSNAVSPEIIPTEKRALKKTVNGNSKDAKLEPQLWNPQLLSTSHSQELFVCSGIVTERKASTSLTKKLQNASSESVSIKESKVLEPDMRSEDSLKQELCYFKPIHPIAITRFKGKIVKCIPIRKSIAPDLIVSTLDISFSKPIVGSFKNSAFARFSTLDDSYELNGSNKSTPKKLPVKKKVNSVKKNSPKGKKNGKKVLDVMSDDKTEEQTPLKHANGKLKRNGKGPFSCTKVASVTKRIPKRLKRSLSFSDSMDEVIIKRKNNSKNGLDKLKDVCNINGMELNNHRTLRSNGSLKKNGFMNHDFEENFDRNLNGRLRNRNKNIRNGSFENELNFSVEDIDQSIIEEQKRIEAIIMQEKKDLLLAKKLQRQLGSESLYTGYTTRTAVKRQATLTEIMPSSKNMKI